MAQAGAGISREVVQPLPSTTGSNALNRALQRLAANPRDAGALVDAGFAALDVGDVDAAVGFFSRADAVDPGNARAQAGLGAAYVRSENPYDALMMFEEAERAGAAPLSLAGDRGLALDLVGDFVSAQSYYRKALTLGPNPEVTRRLAISLAISGDQKGAEAALLPLLQKQDMAAYRARAFVLAIGGDAKGAQQIADQVMPRTMASKISPYLHYMPKLTPAQQAAAANFGQFPSVAQIGKQDPRAAKYTSNIKRPAETAIAAAAPPTGQSALVPAGEPFGRKASADRSGRSNRTAERERPATALASSAAHASRSGKAKGELPSVAQMAAAPRVASATPLAATGELPAVRGVQTVQQAPSQVISAPAGAGAASPRVTPGETRVANAVVPPSIAVREYPAKSQAAHTPGFAGGSTAHTGDAAIASYEAASAPASPRTSPGVAGATSAAPVVAGTASPPAAASPQTPVQQQTATATAPASAPVSVPVETAAQSYGPALQATATYPAQPAAAAPAVAVASAANAPVQQAPAAPSSTPVSLADVFADFAAPTTVQPAPGAVDITQIVPHRETPPVKEAVAEAKPAPPAAKGAAKDDKAAASSKAAIAREQKAQKDAKPKPPSQPSRPWVQVATGRDIKALGFDWRRISGGSGELFKGRQPYVVVWGQSNRLVTGPFPNAGAAQEFVTKAKKAGVDSFVFTSSEGEEVKPLSAR